MKGRDVLAFLVESLHFHSRGPVEAQCSESEIPILTKIIKWGVMHFKSNFRIQC